MKLKERAKIIKNDIPTVFLSLSDKDTPIFAKIIAGITMGYALLYNSYCNNMDFIYSGNSESNMYLSSLQFILYRFSKFSRSTIFSFLKASVKIT